MVWDTHTGVVIKEFGTQGYDPIAFHGDQRTITSVTHQLEFYTYDVFTGTQLCKGQFLQGSSLGSQWAHNNTLQFATSFKTDGKHLINIHELQPTSTPPLHLLSSFPIPPQFTLQFWGFSFSPVSLHVSFVTNTEVTILSVQSSKTLLQAKVAHMAHIPGQFSPNGYSFAYRTLQDEIHVWQNTPTGYLPLSNLRPRLSHHGLLWSPASTSILCFGNMGMELLAIDNCPSPISPNKIKSNLGGNHLVAISADQTCIATAKKDRNIVTVLDCPLGTPQQPINTDMEIQDIKIIDNTIFVMGKYKVSSWGLRPDITRDSTHDVPLDHLLVYGTNSVLSHDCSHIIFNIYERIFLYNIKASKVTSKTTIQAWDTILDLQLSPNQYELWFVKSDRYPSPFPSHARGQVTQTSYDLVKLELGDGSFGNVTIERMRDKLLWVNLFSPHGYHIGESSGWVKDSRGSKLLWLPPNWRVDDWQDIRWNGNFLAFVASRHPEPMIIEFQI